MIIWLASYPKSGNTWMRTIVSTLLHSDDGVFDFSLIKKIDQFPEKKFFRDFVKDFGNFNKVMINFKKDLAEVDYVKGYAMLVDVKKIKKLGMFDKNIFTLFFNYVHAKFNTFITNKNSWTGY